MLYFWIGTFVFLVIVEASTAQLVTIWFAVGAIGALIANVLNAQDWLQWVVFVAVSLITLIATRPLVKKFTKKRFSRQTQTVISARKQLYSKTLTIPPGKALSM